MSISSDLSKLLRGVKAITTAVSGKTAGVYAISIPGKDSRTGEIIQPPLILVTNLGTDFFTGIDGEQNVATGPRKATVDIDCKGKTPAEAAAIFKQVSIFLDDFAGAAGESVIMSVELDDGGEDTEPPISGQDLPTFVETLSTEIIYQ